MRQGTAGDEAVEKQGRSRGEAREMQGTDGVRQ